MQLSGASSVGCVHMLPWILCSESWNTVQARPFQLILHTLRGIRVSVASRGIPGVHCWPGWIHGQKLALPQWMERVQNDSRKVMATVISYSSLSLWSVGRGSAHSPSLLEYWWEPIPWIFHYFTSRLRQLVCIFQMIKDMVFGKTFHGGTCMGLSLGVLIKVTQSWA